MNGHLPVGVPHEQYGKRLGLVFLLAALALVLPTLASILLSNVGYVLMSRCLLGGCSSALASAELFNTALARPGASATAARGLGLLFLYQSRLDDAAFFFSRAVEVEPNHLSSQVSLSNILGAQGLWSEASKACEDSLSLSFDRDLGWMNNVCQARALAAAGQWTKAANAYGVAFGYRQIDELGSLELNLIWRHVCRSSSGVEPLCPNGAYSKADQARLVQGHDAHVSSEKSFAFIYQYPEQLARGDWVDLAYLECDSNSGKNDNFGGSCMGVGDTRMVNLISNAGFEMDLGSGRLFPHGFRPYFPDDWQQPSILCEKNCSDHFLAIHSQSGGLRNHVALREPVWAKPGDTYLLSLDFSNEDGGSLVTGFVWLGAELRPAEWLKPDYQKGKGWDDYSVVVTVPSGTNRFVPLFLNDSPRGDVYIDNMLLIGPINWP